MKIGLLSLLVFVVSLGSYCEPALAKTYSFGIVPQQAARKLARKWVPVLTELKRTTNLDIRFKTAPDIPTFEQRLAAGEYDFAYMNPYHFTVFNQHPGYRALARASKKRIKGIIVVRKETQVESLQDLDASTIAFPAPAAFAATLLTQAEFNRRKIAFSPKYVSSHDSVYRAVAKGLYPAGGGVVRTLSNLTPDVRSKLRILWTTNGFTPHAIAAHPAVPDEVRERISAALASLHLSAHGQNLLQGLSLKGFTNAADQDWNDVRALGIRQLESLSKE